MVSKVGTTGFAMEDIASAIMIIFVILAISDSENLGMTIGSLIVTGIVALLGIIGSIISKFLEAWWSKLISIIGGIIGVIVFFFIIADVVYALALGIASIFVGVGGVIDGAGGLVD
ncbi:MAG: hypothetical protein GF364_07090 [Candidatus Lokiarchaeota archaeon]|nr:hypothetical protein [Candidatus Lokiarchaeota archaeon]